MAQKKDMIILNEMVFICAVGFELVNGPGELTGQTQREKVEKRGYKYWVLKSNS